MVASHNVTDGAQIFAVNNWEDFELTIISLSCSSRKSLLIFSGHTLDIVMGDIVMKAENQQTVQPDVGKLCELQDSHAQIAVG